MVKSGDKDTMLGQWRIVLRQAEEAARAGRFDEALTLANRSDISDHRQAVLLRNRLALDLVGRADRRGKADDLQGAIDDLALAERFGAPPDTLAAARMALADRVADEVRFELDAGEPTRVFERCEALAKQRVSGPALRRLREAAEAWRLALDEARRGEFGRAQEALDRAERLAGDSAKPALANARRDLEGRQAAAHPKVERLYQALSAQRWPEVLAAAESVLENVPDHPAARQARSRAWQQLGAMSPTAALPQRGSPVPFVPALIITDDGEAKRPARGPNRSAGESPLVIAAAPRLDNPGPKGRFLLWADALGGYLVCLENEVVLGRAGPDSVADVPLLGDLSRSHATIVRDGDGYVIRAHHPTCVNGKKVEKAALRNGDVVRLGSSVELEFHQPSPVSSTARLEIVSRHRLPIAVDGVILMADNCILSGSHLAHVPAPMLPGQVVLYRQGAGLACRAPGAFEVDGRPSVGRAGITLQSTIMGEGFSFSLEPLSSPTSQV
jgi:tetratricopeptide (TPR) repeat protein